MAYLSYTSWDACTEKGSISVIQGWSFWPSEVKRSSIGHSPKPCWMLGRLSLFDLGKTSSAFLRNDFSNCCCRDPYIRGVVCRGQLKESCDILSKLHEARSSCNLQEQLRWAWSVKASSGYCLLSKLWLKRSNWWLPSVSKSLLNPMLGNFFFCVFF